MDSNQIFNAITYNLSMVMKSGDSDNREKHINNATHFFNMLITDIRDSKAANLHLGGKVQSNSEPYDNYKHYKGGDIPGLAESWMSTRAGALGETFGEAPSLSQCCQQQIVDNDVCSHCGKKCKEMPNEVKVNEAINKIKNLF